MYNQHLRIDPCTKFQPNQSKIRTRTENGQILGLLVTKFEYDVILTSQLVISSSILLSLVDLPIFNCTPICNFLGLKTKE